MLTEGESEVVAAFAKCLYDDFKGQIFDLKERLFASKNIEKYLMTQLENTSYMNNILFGSNRVSFSQFYQKHKILVNSKEIEDFEVTNLFSTHKHLTLIGDAGMGKSTFIQYLFRDSIVKKFKVPVTLELRNLKGTESIVELIFEKLNSSDNVIPKSFIEKSLKEGTFIIFFDGYDEISNDNTPIITKFIEETRNRYKLNPILLTSRPNAFAEILLNFKACQLCSMDKEEVYIFIEKLKPYFEEEFLINLKKTITNNTYKHFTEYLSNPLLLSLFILCFKHNSSEIPTQLSAFYGQVVEALFIRHDTVSKNSFKRPLESGLSRDEIKNILNFFCLRATYKNTFEFSENEVEKICLEIKTVLKLKFETDHVKMDFLKSLALWVSESGKFKFFHRSIQEYFFAKAISNLSVQKKKQYYSSLLESYTVVRRMSGRNSLSSLRVKLLNELDNNSFNNFFSIPYLKKIKSKLGTPKSKTVQAFFLEVSKHKKFELTHFGGEYIVMFHIASMNSEYLLSQHMNQLFPNIQSKQSAINRHFSNQLVKYATAHNKKMKFDLSISTDFEIFLDILDLKIIQNLVEEFSNVVSQELELLKEKMKQNSYDDIFDSMI